MLNGLSKIRGVVDVVTQWLVRRTWDQKVESSSPGRCTHVVFLGKTLNSHSGSLHPGVKMGTSKLLGDNLTNCWKVTCDGLVSHPGGVEILLVAS